LAGFRIKGPTVQRADDFSLIKHAGAKRTAFVGALVIESAKVSVDIVERKFAAFDMHRAPFSRREAGDISHGHEFAHDLAPSLPGADFFFQGISGNFTGGGFGLAICNSGLAASVADGGAIFSFQEAIRA